VLDWYSGLIAYDASRLKSDTVYRVDAEGRTLWTSPCWVEVEGSYGQSIQLRRKEAPPGMGLWLPGHELENDVFSSSNLLQVSGNPVKYLQGHNAFGPSVALLQPILKGMVKELPRKIRPENADSDAWPETRTSRVDIAVAIEMGSHQDVHEWLRSVGTASRSRHGRALVSGDTVYWGQHSRRWTIKAYCKFCEMAEHRTGDLRLNEVLREYVRNQLRLELTLRTPELKDKDTLDESILWDYFQRIQIGVLEMDRLRDIEKLPRGTQLCLLKWYNDGDVKNIYKRRTFYYHRRIILEEMGVDISISPQEQQSILKRVKYDGKYLMEHEVKKVPGFLQGWLFKPELSYVNQLS